MARTTAVSGRKSSRQMTFIWIVVVVAIIVGLIWKEQVALLYVLATFSVTTLLLIVAFSDLGGSRRPLMEPAPNDDSAAAGDAALRTSSVAAHTAQRR